MADLVTLDQLKLALRLDDGTDEDSLLSRYLIAAQRKCEGYIGRKVEGDEPALTTADRELVAHAVTLLVGFMYRDRDEAQELPRAVVWLLDDVRVVSADD